MTGGDGVEAVAAAAAFFDLRLVLCYNTT